MNTLKHKNMMSAYDGHKGAVSMSAVNNFIPDELFDRLTGRELGLVMSAVNKAYHIGKSKAGAEVLNGGESIYIDCLKAVVDIKAIKPLTE